jgi:hypothetical protein
MLPGVATADVDQVSERILGQFDLAPRSRAHRRVPAARCRAPVVGQRLSWNTRQARQKRRVDLEAWILGRRADQRDRAVLDLRQEGILLGLVEGWIVDEENRRLANLVAKLRLA